MVDFVNLNDRTIIKLSGADVRTFLQGMVTNDMDSLTPDRPLFTALLSPQGKFLFDFFLYDLTDYILLDCNKSQADDLTRRLTMYKMRADVTLELNPKIGGSDVQVWAKSGEFEAAVFQGPDPRHKGLKTRGVLTPEQVTEEQSNFSDNSFKEIYYREAMELGIPSGIADMGSDKTLILEGNYAEINAISYTKGCYVGQENTARMHHRNKVRRRLIPIRTDGIANVGDIIQKGDKKVGEIRSVSTDRAMAYLRAEDLNETLTLENGNSIKIIVPSWMKEVIEGID